MLKIPALHLRAGGPNIPQELRGSAADYQAIWETSAGGVAHLQEPASKSVFAALLGVSFDVLIFLGFVFQTPQDGNSALSCSFEASAVLGSDHDCEFEGNLIFNGPSIADLSQSSWHIPRDWGSTDLPLLVVPLTLLQLHVDLTSSTLAELIQRVESVESKVLSSASGVADFDTLIRALHACNTDLIKLERRWTFEMKLAASSLAVINKYRQPSTNFQELNFGGCTFHGPVNFESGGSGGPSAEQRHGSTIGTTKSFKMLESFAVLQERRSRAIEYDLGVLPRRIANQFTAVGGIPKRPLRSLTARRYILLTGLVCRSIIS